MAFLITFMIMFLFWIVMSGRFDWFHLSLGVISSAIVSYISHDLLFKDIRNKYRHIEAARFIKYIPWLFYQIVVANFYVAFLVLDPMMSERMDPRIIKFKTRLKKEMSLVTFGNSITLTPGTITVLIKEGCYICFAVALLAACGVAFSANLITILVFYEILTLSTYPLVIHHEDDEAVKGARRYIAYLLGTSIAFNLPAIFLTYVFAQTLDFASGGILSGTASSQMITVIFFLFVAGIGKAALMPFHSWLPAAMVAPTPVSALLHAVAVVKAGVFTVGRIVFHVFGIDLLSKLGLGIVLAYIASFTIIVASIIAMRQDNLKRRLAYSTVSQLSYIILGVSLLSMKGITGGITHIAMHTFGKITLFLCAGSILVASGKKNISEMKGIGKKMPITIFAFKFSESGRFSSCGRCSAAVGKTKGGLSDAFSILGLKLSGILDSLGADYLPFAFLL